MQVSSREMGQTFAFWEMTCRKEFLYLDCERSWGHRLVEFDLGKGLKHARKQAPQVFRDFATQDRRDCLRRRSASFRAVTRRR